MIDSKHFINSLALSGIDYAVGVPDSLLKSFCAELEESQLIESTISANEGTAIGTAVGYYMATNKLPLVFLQNSGIGNIVNPLVSLCSSDVYSIPMILVIGWRGEIDEKGNQLSDEPQHVFQGKITIPLLEALNIPVYILGPDSDPDSVVSHSVSEALKQSQPVCILVRKNSFEASSSPSSSTNFDDYELSREDAISTVIQISSEDDVFVSTTGMASRELYELREKLNHSHNQDFLTVGGMGHASSISYGLSLALPEKTITCLDGDAALLMHAGSLSNSSNANNILHIVLNNGCHDSVGGQPSMGAIINLANVAKSMGYANTSTVKSAEDLENTISDFKQKRGSSFIEVLCRPGNRSNLGRPKESPRQNLSEFMNALTK